MKEKECEDSIFLVMFGMLGLGGVVPFGYAVCTILIPSGIFPPRFYIIPGIMVGGVIALSIVLISLYFRGSRHQQNPVEF